MLQVEGTGQAEVAIISMPVTFGLGIVYYFQRKRIKKGLEMTQGLNAYLLKIACCVMATIIIILISEEIFGKLATQIVGGLQIILYTIPSSVFAIGFGSMTTRNAGKEIGATFVSFL